MCQSFLNYVTGFLVLKRLHQRSEFCSWEMIAPRASTTWDHVICEYGKVIYCFPA